VTITLDANSATLSQRFYDSFGLYDFGEPGERKPPARHPERQWLSERVSYTGRLRAVTLCFDHRSQAALLLNGREVLRQDCLFDLSRHQIRLTVEDAHLKGTFYSPAPAVVPVQFLPAERHQDIMGFGGITTPTAYAMLGPQGKRRWWEWLATYNLLIQREYPIGTRLNREMTNWDVLKDATLHSYADNFPNGEISDFNYLKTLRRLGGHVFFEFWGLPPWATQKSKDGGDDWRSAVAEPNAYAKAVVAYCEVSRQKVGQPPDIVGIQNEVPQPTEIWHQMALTLRKDLDLAGFQSVRIHMSDASTLGGGILRAQAFRQSPEVWKITDYTATHVYDYLARFHKPDEFDTLISQWNRLAAGKPFLSTEICNNDPRLQINSYRVALGMGQLYHKNLVLMDASALCYCWLLLNVVQPSYGASRSLFVPQPAPEFVPVPSSRQLRVFGAFSRRIREGMHRIGANSGDKDLLVSAYAGENGEKTVVLLNRSCRQIRVNVQNAGKALREMETVDPYRENIVSNLPSGAAENQTEVLIDPGAIVTLTNVPLGRLPEGFAIAPERH
jgi:O-glycosyl hydrolase